MEEKILREMLNVRHCLMAFDSWDLISFPVFFFLIFQIDSRQTKLLEIWKFFCNSWVEYVLVINMRKSVRYYVDGIKTEP